MKLRFSTNLKAEDAGNTSQSFQMRYDSQGVGGNKN
jgi:hypothetical protein